MKEEVWVGVEVEVEAVVEVVIVTEIDLEKIVEVMVVGEIAGLILAIIEMRKITQENHIIIIQEDLTTDLIEVQIDPDIEIQALEEDIK
mgnify:CR=1 FL=1